MADEIVPPIHLWTKEKGEELEKWLIDKWGGDKRCPMCDKPELRIGPSPTMLVNAGTDGKSTFMGGGYPTIVIVCNNCGNTLLVNGLVAGIFHSDEQKEAGNG